MMDLLCIYHFPCQDGFTAAWVVWQAYKGKIDMFPAKYQMPPPDVRGRNVIFVDFAYKRDVMLKIMDEAKSVTVLDHHQSAIEDLKDIPFTESVFNIECSGAGIAWDFYNSTPRPALIKHVEDRDLWKFMHHGTREISARLFAEEYRLNEWTDHVRRLESEVFWHDWYNEGAAILKKQMKDIRELIEMTCRTMYIAGHRVPVCCIPYTMVSEAGNILAEDEKFAACYWDSEHGREFSLRSRPSGEDVSVIAFQYGGGGHKHAAGFRVPFNKLADLGLL